MSPRGVAVPNVRERLFEAAERVLERDGPAALTNRAITEEAGCAKGLLYNHFTDLDDFVAQLVLNRFQRVVDGLAPLPARAGTGDVLDNLVQAARTLLGSNGPALAAAAMSRSRATIHVRQEWAGGAAGPASAEELLTGYLEAEQKLGRVSGTADCAMLGLAIAGTVHHLVMTGAAVGEEGGRLVARLVTAVAAGAVAPPP
ncbi:TetR/AcrR family transcriptional regulator [Streptomyces sp. CB01881]|uniref:TetR/AcrR family transcriptional regulator n=1 Tax=Streptomyces sp. CB01881 TaxID=2078691 RepID=UPI000CDC6F7E|nr:TetR/AcrR family transcriptional regulator [Streptomyces sp. CB01881]AUY50614.1 TetR family transcriptional regulator [Streptomyces sp. CB01881]TYC74000.1 TetR/AcrR family transcriptional regulator [Streptomyces sp. CB01881]